MVPFTIVVYNLKLGSETESKTLNCPAPTYLLCLPQTSSRENLYLAIAVSYIFCLLFLNYLQGLPKIVKYNKTAQSPIFVIEVSCGLFMIIYA